MTGRHIASSHHGFSVSHAKVHKTGLSIRQSSPTEGKKDAGTSVILNSSAYWLSCSIVATIAFCSTSGVKDLAWQSGSFERNTANAHSESRGRLAQTIDMRTRQTHPYFPEPYRTQRLGDCFAISVSSSGSQQCCHYASTKHHSQNDIIERRASTHHKLAKDKRVAIIERERTRGRRTDMRARTLSERTPMRNRVNAHKTKGDLIFSASRTRLILFHACIASGEHIYEQAVR